jgi:uncharacterized protein YkwD
MRIFPALRLAAKSAGVMFAACVSVAGFGADPPATTPAQPPASIAARIVAQTNTIRGERRLAALTVNPRLEAAAQRLADHMARTGVFGHEADGRTVSQRVELQGYQWTFVAENIAFQQPAAADTQTAATQFMDQWLRSPGHSRNIVAPQAREIGAATAVSPAGATYAVQVFAAP